MEIENVQPAGHPPAPSRPARDSKPAAQPPAPPVQETADEVSLSTGARSALGQAPEVARPDALLNNLERIRSLTENNDLVVKVVDPETGEVIRQIPHEESLQLRDAIRTILDQSRPDI